MDYIALMKSIDAALRVIGDRSVEGEEFRVRSELMRLRETVIRARRDRTEGAGGRRDSRSPQGVS